MGEEVVTTWWRRSAALALAATLLTAGCGAARRTRIAAAPRAGRCAAGTIRALGSPERAYVALVRGRVRAFHRLGASPIAWFGHDNLYGVPTVFSVRASVLGKGCRAVWYRVQLPLKPNGTVGYVRAPKVELASVRTRISVDLSARLLTLFRDGRALLRVRVGVGSRQTPTPTGSFYVNQRFREDPAGPYGPAALGISAYSTVLTWWAQGGPIAIHGTNQPWTIGRAASNGCIHVQNRILDRLFRLTPAGTPVVITA
ncbi:MAG TPA: L,D-transpeptidase [Gaiellaceae bacterium]